MESAFTFGWLFLAASFLATIINLSLLAYLVRKAKSNVLNERVNLNSKEFDLIQRQYIFLQAKTDMSTKRLDTLEKVLSALIVSANPGDSSDGFTH